jgi:hypothetical protein
MIAGKQLQCSTSIQFLNKFLRVYNYICFYGTLAQSVQSACFTRKKSLVRILYVPLRGGATSPPDCATGFAQDSQGLSKVGLTHT